MGVKWTHSGVGVTKVVSRFEEANSVLVLFDDSVFVFFLRTVSFLGSSRFVCYFIIRMLIAITGTLNISDTEIVVLCPLITRLRRSYIHCGFTHPRLNDSPLTLHMDR